MVAGCLVVILVFSCSVGFLVGWYNIVYLLLGGGSWGVLGLVVRVLLSWFCNCCWWMNCAVGGWVLGTGLC